MGIFLKIERRNLVFLFFVVFIFTQISLIKAENRNLNLYHVIALIYLVFIFIKVIFRKKIIRINLYLILLFLMTSLLSFFLWNSPKSIVLILFCLLYVVIGYDFSHIGSDARKKIYNIAMWFFVISTVIRDLYHLGNLNVIYSYGNGGGWSLATGGPNIEATIFAILGILYTGRYKFILGVIMTLSIILFESRIGFIGASIFWFRYFTGRRRVFVILALIISSIIIFPNLENIKILNRFSVKNEEKLGDDGLGRLALWKNAIRGIESNPLGIGPGNSVNYINSHYGTSFWENNIHNVFMTWIFELGWFIALPVIFLFVYLIVNSWLKFHESQILLYIFVCCFVQFIGYDVLIWFFIGIIMGCIKNAKVKNCY